MPGKVMMQRPSGPNRRPTSHGMRVSMGLVLCLAGGFGRQAEPHVGGSHRDGEVDDVEVGHALHLFET